MIQGKQVNGGEVQTVTFSVTGEFITEHARDRVRPGDLGWQSALRFLTDSICGLSMEDAIDILKGEMRFTGSSADPKGILFFPEDSGVRDQIRAEHAKWWGGIVRELEGRPE